MQTGGYFDASDKAILDRIGTKTYTGSDWGAHLKLGYSWQTGNVVTGIDISADTGFDQSVNASAPVSNLPNNRYNLAQRIKSDPLIAIRPRIGWVSGNTMSYVTAGLVAARVTLDTTYRDDNYNGSTGGFGFSSQSDTKLGAVFGFGTEYALGKAWSLSAQYLYTDLGSMSATTRVRNPVNGNGVFNSSVELRTQSLMFGLTYRFKE